MGAPGGLDVAVLGSASGNPTAATMVRSQEVDGRCGLLEEAGGVVRDRYGGNGGNGGRGMGDGGVIGRDAVFVGF